MLADTDYISEEEKKKVELMLAFLTEESKQAAASTALSPPGGRVCGLSSVYLRGEGGGASAQSTGGKGVWPQLSPLGGRGCGLSSGYLGEGGVASAQATWGKGGVASAQSTPEQPSAGPVGEVEPLHASKQHSNNANPTSEEDLCPICYAHSISAIFRPCSHKSCKACINQHLMNNKDCFFCKATIIGVDDYSKPSSC
ncbi:E3 ubiquitin-protein ligase RNF123 [Takifugu flavidus]|uniref:RING-type E3 ubiquitin transferase n=1 Tax=Takifugu flavidus TaxID=433684 RepID=A0A5C6N6N6_9TELE|nr:E3 ubiquitin-protein ligase RNF123 [Takifugu flavidus]